MDDKKYFPLNFLNPTTKVVNAIFSLNTEGLNGISLIKLSDGKILEKPKICHISKTDEHFSVKINDEAMQFGYNEITEIKLLWQFIFGF